MAKSRTKMLESAIGAILLACVVTGCTSSNPVRFPKELLDDDEVFLGQSISALKASHQLDWDDSEFCYSELANGLSPFETIRYNCAVASLTNRPRTVESLTLGIEDQAADSSVDILVQRIVALCDSSFGSNFRIIDLDTHKDDTLRRPCLIWESDTYVAYLIFMPRQLYKKLAENQKWTPDGLSLTLARTLLPEWDARPESKVRTRESLGLESR